MGVVIFPMGAPKYENDVKWTSLAATLVGNIFTPRIEHRNVADVYNTQFEMM